MRQLSREAARGDEIPRPPTTLVTATSRLDQCVSLCPKGRMRPSAARLADELNIMPKLRRSQPGIADESARERVFTREHQEFTVGTKPPVSGGRRSSKRARVSGVTPELNEWP